MSAPAVLAQRQALFASTYLPVITERFAFRFRTLAPEARSEAIQDATATAWACFTRVADAGAAWDGVAADRKGCATPSSIAAFTASHYAMGRRFLGSSVTDPLSPTCQHQGRAHVRHLGDGNVGDYPGTEVPAALLARACANPATQVRLREDWRTIARHCSPRAGRVLALLIRGWRTGDIAKHLRVSAGRVSQLKTEIARIASGLGYQPT